LNNPFSIDYIKPLHTYKENLNSYKLSIITSISLLTIISIFIGIIIYVGLTYEPSMEKFWIVVGPIVSLLFLVPFSIITLVTWYDFKRYLYG